jgi:glutamine amidotransferase
VKQACETVGLDALITYSDSEIMAADAVILPGVGAFGDAMEVLRRINLIDVLCKVYTSSKPLLGICLGMQLLMSESEEFGIHKGLNIIDGHVTRFPNFNDKKESIKVPHIGWNRIFFDESLSADGSILNNLRGGEFMYFVHSYFVIPNAADSAITYTDYCGIRYCSGIRKDNLMAFQFHPEKSGPHGIQIYKNFKEIILKGRAR